MMYRFTVEDPKTWTRPWSAGSVQEPERHDSSSTRATRTITVLPTCCGALARTRSARRERRNDNHVHRDCHPRGVAHRRAAPRASRVLVGVRHHQAAEADGNAHQVEDVSTLIPGSTWTSSSLMEPLSRGWSKAAARISSFASGCYEEHTEGRHRIHDSGLSGARRHEQSGRPQFHPRRRLALPVRRIRSRCWWRGQTLTLQAPQHDAAA